MPVGIVRSVERCAVYPRPLMMRGAKFVRPPFGTELLANACIIYGEKALTADPDMEEEHEPCFWVEEGLDHLVLLERLILYARLVLSDLVVQ
jgi:hypothetical protein